MRGGPERARRPQPEDTAEPKTDKIDRVKDDAKSRAMKLTEEEKAFFKAGEEGNYTYEDYDGKTVEPPADERKPDNTRPFPADRVSPPVQQETPAEVVPFHPEQGGDGKWEPDESNVYKGEYPASIGEADGDQNEIQTTKERTSAEAPTDRESAEEDNQSPAIMTE